MEVVIGIDLGTQGVRCLAVTAEGKVLAQADVKLELSTPSLPEGWAEQDPLDWWRVTATCLRALTAQLHSTDRVVGVCVDSTSGTVLPIDAAGEPLHNALMYNDSRSAPYVALVREAAAEFEEQIGYAFNASFALPKIIWLEREVPDLREHTCCYIHAADFICGRLSGIYNRSDYSNALKTGYDLINARYPSFISEKLGLDTSQLPEIVAPGTPISAVNQRATDETGLPVGAIIVAGATDGTAAQIASGAVVPGAWNSSLGTTLVIKGITKQLLRDPLHRIYSHRHPEGWWMPGGASNTGCEWIMKQYQGQDLQQLDEAAFLHSPTSLIRYPLARSGERFPFLAARAEGFTLDANGTLIGAGHEDYYAAGLEGTAMLERLAYDTLADIGADVSEYIHMTGGGSKSLVWSQIRASMLRRQLVRPKTTETAMGAALLAGAGVWYGNLSDAARAMVSPSVTIDPVPALIEPYSAKYTLFCEALRARGYLAA